MIAKEVAERIAALAHAPLRGDGSRGFLVPCPAHPDREPSLHVSPGAQHSVVLKCFAGCSTEAVLGAAGLSWSDLCSPTATAVEQRVPKAEYAYADAAGGYLFSVARYGHGRGKRFKVRRHGETGAIVGNARGLHRVLYRLPEVASAVAAGETVYLCEGEKDADAMREAYGVTATTNPFGAVAWANDCERFGYADYLRGARVVIVQDKDATGRKRTAQLLRSLSGIVREVRVVEASVGKDAADHVAAGAGLSDFVEVSPEVLLDDGAFAALPQAFLTAVETVNLSHLEHRLLLTIAWRSVRRENRRVVWRPIACPSSWLAKSCGNASPSAVRGALRRLRDAGLLIAPEASSIACGPQGQAPLLRVNEEYSAWKPLRHGA